MHIANLKHRPANPCIEVDSLLVQHQLRSTIETHEPLVLALTDLAKTIHDAQLEVKSGKLSLSNDELELVRECCHYITRATAILIIASNHEYAISRSAEVLKTVVERIGGVAARLCPDDFLNSITRHVLHENFVDLHESFLAKTSASEILCQVGERLKGELSVGVGNIENHKVHKWTADGFFEELLGFDYELKTIGEAELTQLEQEVVKSKVFRRKPYTK